MNSPLFTAGQVVELTAGQLLSGDPETPLYGFTNDSRQVAKGHCFVALRGEQADGHRFAPAAFAAGAAAALVKEPVPGPCVIQVAEPLLALGQLARHRLAQHPVPVVGITGSVGKTTTKEMVAAVLAERFSVLKNPGNFNSEIGLPLTLFGLAPGHQLAVLEMGMRGAGEIAYLCSIARPQVAVVTNVGESHLELLGSVDNIAKAKAELVAGLAPAGVAILNADDARVAAMAPLAPGQVLTYGLRGAADLGVRDWVSLGAEGQRFTLVTPLGSQEVQLPAVGEHNLINALAAAGVGLAFGLTLTQIANGLTAYRPAEGRQRLLSAGQVRLIDDTYNAAPTSMAAALTTLRELAGEGRAIAVLGSMFELGEGSEAAHRRVGQAAAQWADVVYTVGNEAAWIAAEVPGARHFADQATLTEALLADLTPGDTVLVKGSRGMQMEQIVAALTEGLTGPG